jgi:acetyl esterase
LPALALLPACAQQPAPPAAAAATAATETAAPQPRQLELRALLLRSAEQNRANAVPVAAVEDVTTLTADGPLRLRIHRGTTHAGAPAILSLHGGGWVAGSIDTHDTIHRRLAATLGAVVVSVDYRLAPEHPYPAALEDSDAALAWLFAHARRLGVDPARIALAGDSSGGNLAAVTAARYRDRGDRRLAALLLVNPVLNLASLDTASYRRAGAKSMQEFIGFYVPAGTDPAPPSLSPGLLADVRGLPPTLVISAENDALLDEDEAYAKRLSAAGVRATLFRQDGVPHFGMRWANTDPSVDAALAHALSFLRSRLFRPGHSPRTGE